MIRSMEEFVSAFHAARCVSTPLVAVRTADPASTTQLLIEALTLQSRNLNSLGRLITGLRDFGRSACSRIGAGLPGSRGIREYHQGPPLQLPLRLLPVSLSRPQAQ